MAVKNTKGSVSKISQAKPDAPANDVANPMQAAVESLLETIIEAADSVRRT